MMGLRAAAFLFWEGRPGNIVAPLRPKSTLLCRVPGSTTGHSLAYFTARSRPTLRPAFKNTDASANSPLPQRYDLLVEQNLVQGRGALSDSPPAAQPAHMPACLPTPHDAMLTTAPRLPLYLFFNLPKCGMCKPQIHTRREKCLYECPQGHTSSVVTSRLAVGSISPG